MVLCVAVFVFPAPLSGLQVLSPLVGLALLFLGWLIALNLDGNFICKITPQGISAPTGFLALTTTFVPWEDVAECIFIHDEGYSVRPHFQVRDRAGCLQFKLSHTWLYAAKPADRSRIIEELRSRFPRRLSGEIHDRLKPVFAKSSEVWDRELDG